MPDLSKIEAGQLTLRSSTISIKDMVQNEVGVVESLAKNKNRALNIELPPQLWADRGDERGLPQVLVDLVGNVLKLTDHGSVTIKAVAYLDRLRSR